MTEIRGGRRRKRRKRRRRTRSQRLRAAQTWCHRATLSGAVASHLPLLLMRGEGDRKRERKRGREAL